MRKALGTAVLAVALVLTTAGGAGAADPRTRGTEGITVGPQEIRHGKVAAAGACVAWGVGDPVHISRTPPATISGHGWWLNQNCTRGLKAVVTTQVQKKNVLGLWVDVGTQGKKTVYAGGGSANRSVSRYTCSGSATHTFRSWVDVDIVGVIDTPGKVYTDAVDKPCN